MRKIRQEIGLTLIELVVVVAITGITVVPLAAIFQSQLRIPAKLAAEVIAGRQIQTSTLLIIEDARAAQTFTTGDDPIYGTFTWNEFAGPAPIPVISIYRFASAPLIRDGDVPKAVRSAISSNSDGSEFTVRDDDGTTRTLNSSNSVALDVPIDDIEYNLGYSASDIQVTITLSSGSSPAGTLTAPRQPGKMVRILERGGEITPPMVILEGIISYEQIRFELTDRGWQPTVENGKTTGFEYTDGKIVVTISQVHEGGAEFGEVTAVEFLVADFRPHDEREVARPPLSGVQPTGDTH